jgi:hypothetical protein
MISYNCTRRGMMNLAVIGALVGVALGLRSKGLVLVPAVMLAGVFPILIGVGRGDSFWSIVLTAVAVVIAFQLGYLAGFVIRAVIEEIFPGNGDSDQNLGMRLAKAVSLKPAREYWRPGRARGH